VRGCRQFFGGASTPDITCTGSGRRAPRTWIAATAAFSCASSSGEGHGRGTDVLVHVGHLRGAGNRNDPRLLVHEPRHAWDEPFQRSVGASEGRDYRVLTPMLGEPVRVGDAQRQFSTWWRAQP